MCRKSFSGKYMYIVRKSSINMFGYTSQVLFIVNARAYGIYIPIQCVVIVNVTVYRIYVPI